MPFNFKSLCSNLIPAGKYKAIVTDMKFASGGAKSILVTLTISEGPYAKRNHIETIPEKAYSFKLMPLLKACKVDVEREFATAEELYKFGFASAKGKEIVIEMGVRTYNGQEYNNVTDFSPLADSTVSVDDITESFGTVPEVKASTPIADMVEEETKLAPNTTPGADEPELSVDLSDVTDDLENPF